MKRGICWVTWGDNQPEHLWRSVKSAKFFGFSTCLITAAPIENGEMFDYIVPYTPDYFDARGRVAAFQELTPFDVTLHLDTDTVICRDVSYGFKMAERHGLGCCIAPACDATLWHKLESYPPGLVQYNAGALFFTNKCKRLFTEWRRLNKLNLSSISKQDQPGLAIAIYELGFNPYVLPHTWNFRPDFGHISGFGPIYIWHSQKPVPHGVGDLPGFWKFQQ